METATDDNLDEAQKPGFTNKHLLLVGVGVVVLSVVIGYGYFAIVGMPEPVVLGTVKAQVTGLGEVGIKAIRLRPAFAHGWTGYPAATSGLDPSARSAEIELVGYRSKGLIFGVSDRDAAPADWRAVAELPVEVELSDGSTGKVTLYPAKADSDRRSEVEVVASDGQRVTVAVIAASPGD